MAARTMKAIGHVVGTCLECLTVNRAETLDNIGAPGGI